MERPNIPPKVKSKPSNRKKDLAPNWQSSITDTLSESAQTSSVTLDSKKLRTISDSLPDESKIVSLSDLSTNFSQHLPLRVQIVTGFCAANDKDPTLDIDDIYNIHLLKHTDLVTIRDTSGEHYDIPLYSSLQFGLVYEPRNETKTFTSVSEIMKAKPLPKVVIALDGYYGHSEKSSLCQNELLIIHSMHKYGGGLKKPSLKVYSITSSTKKDLPSDCTSVFSTDPWLTRLYVSDLMEFAPNPLPCNARLYFDESVSLLPEHLFSQIVTIDERHTNSSFLVSLDRERHRRGKRIEVNELIDIPTGIGIDVHILNPFKAKERYHKLYEDTALLLKEFNPAKVKACVDAPSDDVYITQAQLLAQIRQGYENVGLNIETPAIIGEYEPLSQSTIDAAPQYEDLDFVHGQVTKKSPLPTASVPKLVSTHASTHPKTEESPPPPPLRKVQQNAILLPPIPPRPKPSTLHDTHRDSKASQESQSCTVSDESISPDTTTLPTSLEATVNRLSERLQLVEKQMSVMAADIHKLKVANNVDTDDHLPGSQSLQLMTRDDVLRLLDDLNIPQYKDIFRKEMVDGEILSEIDENVLQQELGMNSKLHRLRLMKYIDNCSNH